MALSQCPCVLMVSMSLIKIPPWKLVVLFPHHLCANYHWNFFSTYYFPALFFPFPHKYFVYFICFHVIHNIFSSYLFMSKRKVLKIVSRIIFSQRIANFSSRRNPKRSITKVQVIAVYCNNFRRLPYPRYFIVVDN